MSPYEVLYGEPRVADAMNCTVLYCTVLYCVSPYEELYGEPRVADALHEEEGVVRVGAVLVQRPASRVQGGPNLQIV